VYSMGSLVLELLVCRSRIILPEEGPLGNLWWGAQCGRTERCKVGGDPQRGGEVKARESPGL